MIALRMICAMLLVFLGFASRPITAAATPLPDVAGYVLPDGTVSSLCLSGQADEQGKHAGIRCEACRLASSVALPVPPAEAREIARTPTTLAFAFAPESLGRLIFPPNAPPRGPPSIPVFVDAA